MEKLFLPVGGISNYLAFPAANSRAPIALNPKEGNMKNRIATIFLLAGMALPALAVAQTSSRQAQQDQKTAELVTAQMQKKDKFRSVAATVDDGIVTLTGEVPLYIDKVNAEKRARKVKDVDGVRNHVQVGGPAIRDADIQENLSNKLRYDRVGFGI